MKNPTQRLFLKPLKILGILSLVSLFFSCSQEDDFTEIRYALSLQTQMDASVTRATADNTWEGNEQVQVSIDDKKATPFIAARSGTLTPVTPLFWESSIQAISARAWYPASWKMKPDQSTSDDYQEADFIFAKTVSEITLANYAKKAGKLTFSHQMAKVIANLTGENISSVSEVAFYGFTSGKANTTTGVIENGKNNKWIKAYNKEENSYEALLIPQKMEAGSKFIQVTIDSSSNYYYTLVSDVSLEAGELYIYNITLKKTD
ncbi:hypothetical protein EZS27_016070 [termite gut metagenome]|uniref:Fimbrillin family protein n=1 Tax=termite gut metagenome TaxID=433724 RepID=A0A5J4RQE9_9ZZZZ